MSTTDTPNAGGAELLPCPFCGGKAELDGCQYYRAMNGKAGTRAVIYCLSCGSEAGMCREDLDGEDREHIVQFVTSAWNRRAARAPSPAPLATGGEGEKLASAVRTAARSLDARACSAALATSPTRVGDGGLRGALASIRDGIEWTWKSDGGVCSSKGPRVIAEAALRASDAGGGEIADWPYDDLAAHMLLRGSFDDTGGVLSPKPGHEVSDAEQAAINYLCAEWDYGYCPTPLPSAPPPPAAGGRGDEGVPEPREVMLQMIGAQASIAAARTQDGGDDAGT